MVFISQKYAFCPITDVVQTYILCALIVLIFTEAFIFTEKAISLASVY